MTTYKTIADLPGAGVSNDTDLFEASQAGLSRAVTLGQMSASIMSDVAAILASGGATPVSSVAALKALTIRPSVVITRGYNAVNDGGGGPPWVWVAGSSAVADDFMVVSPAGSPTGRYIRQFQAGANVSPKWAGCGLGAADDSAQFQKVIDFGAAIDLSGGTYPVKNLQVESTTRCPGLFSDGSATVVPAPGSTSTTPLFAIKKDDFTVDGIFFDLPISTTPGSPPAADRSLYFVSTGELSRHRVTNCRHRGGRFGFVFAGTSENYALCQGNVITNVWAEAISIPQPKIVHIIDNQISDCGFDSLASGAIRIGTSTQNAIAESVVISGNIIKRCGENISQEGIDVTGEAFLSISVTDNLIEDCGNGGVEVKTTASVVVPDVLQSVVVSNNIIRMKTGQGVGVAMNIADAVTPAGKPNHVRVSDNHISCLTPALAATANYGVLVSGYTAAEVVGNTIFNTSKGVDISGSGVVGTTQVDTLIARNSIDVSDRAVSVGTGTFDKVRILHNRMRSAGRVLEFSASILSNSDISWNRLESTAGIAIEIRDVRDTVFSFNSIIATSSAVLSQVTAPTNVSFKKNRIVSGSHAFNFGVGTGLKVFDNDVELPNNFRVVSGAGTFVAHSNVRGTAAADPSGTIGGSRGDLILNSAVVSSGFEAWICTTAHDTTATYKGTRAIA